MRRQRRFVLGLSAGVRAEIFTLANPYRVIVDLPDVAFHLPEGTGQKGSGLITAFRYGLFAEGKARIVIDTTGPVRIEARADDGRRAGTPSISWSISSRPSAESFGCRHRRRRVRPAAAGQGGAAARRAGRSSKIASSR